MKLMRLSKKLRRAAVLGENAELGVSWASGPGYRGGPENYFSLDVEAEGQVFVLEFDLDESRRIKEQLDDFLQHVDKGKPWWEPGNYFRKIKFKQK